jgi:hypothetical protein
MNDTQVTETLQKLAHYIDALFVSLRQLQNMPRELAWRMHSLRRSEAFLAVVIPTSCDGARMVRSD